MQLQLYQVRYFLALAKTRNFTRAAEQCNVTQPALTKAIQKLEQELGGALIHRERHLTQLTDLGKMIFAHAGENIFRRRGRTASGTRLSKEDNSPA
ncbi:DNA-binding transcriptional LysR family regulator [Bradyrhizobium ottawaense]|uniref:LysR family transcriptional regulator n=1 Tax=Bradyrhizobium ottawaense TaxID=931866 RepID=UPI00351566AA